MDVFTDYYPRERKEANLAEARTYPGFSFAALDLADASLESLVAETDGIFHLAAQPGVRGSWGETFAVYVRDNIHATQRVLRQQPRRSGASSWRRVLLSTGTPEAYPTSERALPRPVSPYGVTKLACEFLARSYVESLGLEVISLRYFTVRAQAAP